ncbi:MAG: twin-arginine translocation signal domain-containing protein, partial [Gammaproteobacteria bacterium]
MKIRRNGSVHAESISLPRRRFVQGLAAGGALAGLGLLSAPVPAGASAGTRPRELSGTEFDLVIGEMPV